MKNIVVKVENLSKIYRLYNKPMDRLKEALHPFKKKYHRNFYALKDITFDIKRGETIGIIGKNGSGKSTLLKIITGVLKPTQGNLEVNGRISALLELGAGFNPEYTGIQNIYLNGTMMGYNKHEIDEKLYDILSFADIGDFIHQPVKTYSSGMFVRLAFSVATNINPDILIVDEALSVGDMFFQSKCMDKMKKMIDNGTTLLFVSHDMAAVKSVCKKSILLNEGKILNYDKSEKIVEDYFAIKVRSEQKIISFDKTNATDKNNLKEKLKKGKHERLIFSDNKEFQKRASFQRLNNGKAHFVNILLLNENEIETSVFEYNETLILRMAIEICEDIEKLAFGYHIRDKNGVDIVYSDSEIENTTLLNVKKGEKLIIDWKFKTSFIQGDYNIACVLSIPVDLEVAKVDFCDFIPFAVQFKVMPRKHSMLYGNVHLDNLVDVKKTE